MFHSFSTSLRRTTRLGKLESLILVNAKNNLGKHLKTKLSSLMKDHLPKRRYGPTGENGSLLPPNGLNTSRSIASSPRPIFMQTTPHSPINIIKEVAPYTNEDFIAVFGSYDDDNNVGNDNNIVNEATVVKDDNSLFPNTTNNLKLLRSCLEGEFIPKGKEKRLAILELINKFKRSPNDTSSAEIQIAILSLRIHDLEKHCIFSLGGIGHKDQKAKQSLIRMRSKRQKWLKYLGKQCLERLYKVIDELGLPSSIMDTAIANTGMTKIYPAQWYSKERIFIKNRRLRQEQMQQRLHH